MMLSRRILIQKLIAGAAAVPLCGLLGAPATAAEHERLDVDDPAAKSLNYRHESGDPSRRCDGCQFYLGDADADWGPCVIFPGKQVKATGVCNSWFAKSG